MGAFSFDSLSLVGELEAWGQLARCQIMNDDGTYFSGFAISSSVGRGGLSRTYAYDAQLDARFNGVINVSAGTFTNGPNQEIGIVAGASANAALLQTPGIDADSDGNPDAWPGNGTGNTPPQGTVVNVDPAITQAYFCRGQFIDVYRFRYT